MMSIRKTSIVALDFTRGATVAGSTFCDNTHSYCRMQKRLILVQRHPHNRKSAYVVRDDLARLSVSALFRLVRAQSLNQESLVCKEIARRGD